MLMNNVGIDVSVVVDFDVDNSAFDVVAFDADVVNVDVDVFTSLIQFNYLPPDIQLYVNPVRLRATVARRQKYFCSALFTVSGKIVTVFLQGFLTWSFSELKYLLSAWLLAVRKSASVCTPRNKGLSHRNAILSIIIIILLSLFGPAEASVILTYSTFSTNDNCYILCVTPKSTIDAVLK